jgi:apolipoprotein N-acyltransferase
VADSKNVPLVVDLDGTLIRTDMMWESLARLLRRNPLAIFQILFWWTRGRAWLKQNLAARVQVDPAALPYNKKFLAWLREEKKSGRKLILATASDLKMAQPVAAHVGLFDEVLASDGKTNLRSENKLRALTAKFGERGFDYAGNSDADFAVWRGSREAVVVNASRRVLREAGRCTRLGPTFCETFSAVAVAQSVGTELLWRSGYLTAIIAGLLLASAFPHFNFAGFAWIAPALMLFAARGKNGADAARVGYVSGLAFWLASLYWLLLIPVAGFPILGWIALGAFCALFSAAWVWLAAGSEAPMLKHDSWARRTLWTLTGAAAWVALEMIRARLFSGFPWNLLGVSQFKIVPLIQVAAVTGVYGVSFLIAWFSLALYSAAQMILRHPTKRFVWQAEIVLPLVATVFCFVGGFFSLNRQPADHFARVTCIQPSVPQSLIWSSNEDSQRFRELLALSQSALTNQTDLLLWPESAVPFIDDATYRAINQFAQSNHVPIIFNGDDVEFHPAATNFFNSAFLVGADGQWRGVYHKRQLVIFGEYVPLARWLPFLKWFTPITGGWTSGDKAVTFQIEKSDASASEPDKIIFLDSKDGSRGRPLHQTFKVSPLICFEDVFPGTSREAATDDADFLVNLTNDGWFGDSAEQWQHCAAAVFRAVENNLPLVRCANNGVTGLIDANGRIQSVFTDATGDVHGQGAMMLEVPITENRTPTFYHQHGDWFGWGCVAVTIGLLAQLIWRRKSDA